MDGFHESLYSTSAQVIPVFFLAIFGAGYLYRKEVMTSPQLSLLGIAVIGMVVLGEVVAITALQQRKDPSGLGQLAVFMGLYLPILALTLPLLVAYTRTLFDHLPHWATVVRNWALLVGAVAVVVAGFVGDLTQVLVGVLAITFLIAYAVSCWWGFTPGPSGNDEEP